MREVQTVWTSPGASRKKRAQHPHDRWRRRPEAAVEHPQAKLAETGKHPSEERPAHEDRGDGSYQNRNHGESTRGKLQKKEWGVAYPNRRAGSTKRGRSVRRGTNKKYAFHIHVGNAVRVRDVGFHSGQR